MAKARTRVGMLVLLVGIVVLVLWRRGQHRMGPVSATEGSRAPDRGGSFAPAPAAEKGGGGIEGVVLDAAGRPVDGARLTLTRSWKRDAPPSVGLFDPIVASTTSAGGGRFRFTELAADVYGVNAITEGARPGFAGPVTVKARAVTTLEVRLGGAGLLLSGRILDVSGGTVPGAKLNLGFRGGPPGQPPEVATILSDGDGGYRVTLAPGTFWVTVIASGYATLRQSVLLTRPTTRDFRLAPGARITGRVVERGSRQPVADAEVSLRPPDFSGGPFNAPVVHTDAAGAFSLAELEAGSYQLAARKGRLTGIGRQLLSVGLAQALSDQEIEVSPGSAIVGHVRKAGKGTPIADASVAAYLEGSPMPRPIFGTTDGEGAFSLEGLVPGRYRVDANAQGYGRALKTLEVGASDATAELELAAGVVVKGRVLDSSGKPVPGAAVTASSEVSGQAFNTTMDQVSTNDEGAFELTRLGAGSVTVTAQKADLGLVKQGPEPLGSGEHKELTLKLGPGSYVSGTVHFTDGTPAPGVQVGGMVQRSGTPPTTITGGAGEYRVGPLPRGKVTVTADRKGNLSWRYGNDPPNQKTLELGDAEEKTGVDLVIGKGGGSLSGMVVDSEGKPVELATVIAGANPEGETANRGFHSERTFTGSDGKFSFEDLTTAPTYTLWAEHPEHAGGEVKGVKAGARDVRIALARDTSVSGQAVDGGGKPVGDYTITAAPGPVAGESPEAARRRRAMVWERPKVTIHDPGGAFTLRKLVGGSYELLVATVDGRSGSAVVDLVAGDHKKDVRVVVQSGARVTGRVLEVGSNAPIVGGQVAALGPGNARATTTTGADGTFVLESAPHDGPKVRLNASAEDVSAFLGETKTIDLPASGDTVDAGTIHLLRANWRARAEAGDPGYAGVLADVDHDVAVITGVKSPGQELGVKKGDRLLSIDGTDTTDLGPRALNYLIQGDVGKPVSLTIATPGSAPHIVTIPRISHATAAR